MLNLLINTADPEQDGLLDSFFSSGKAVSQDLVRNDKVLAFQIVPVVPSDRETQLWDADHLSTDTYLVAVGNEDEPPTGGTWPLTLGANTATAIAYNVTAAALETALMAAGFGTLTVSLLQAGVYQVTWTANGAVAQMTSGANTLTPDAGVTINVVAAGSVSTQAVQVITLRQSVVAAAAPATQLPAAGIAATIARAGSGTQNKIYSLTMTPGTYGGTFSLTVTAATGSAQGLGVVDANISAADFAALLATQTVIASTDNVSVQRVGTVLNVEFIGTQGLSNVPVIAVANIDLLAPKGVSGTINFNTIPLNRAFWNTTETELTYRFAVRRTRATGEEREFYNASVTLKRNLIDASTMVAVFTGGITVGATGISGGTSGRVLYDNAGVVGEYAISGTGSVAMTDNPAFNLARVYSVTDEALRVVCDSVVDYDEIFLVGMGNLDRLFTVSGNTVRSYVGFLSAEVETTNLYLVNGSYRTTVTSAASGSNKTASFPNVSGTVAVAATTTTATHALFGTTTAGAPAYRAVAGTDLTAALKDGTIQRTVVQVTAVSVNGTAGTASSYVSVASGANPTFTTSAAHGFSVGTVVTISGIAGAGATVANGTWTVATAGTPTTFTVGASLTTSGASAGTTGIVVGANVTKITTATAHGYAAGDKVIFSGLSGPGGPTDHAANWTLNSYNPALTVAASPAPTSLEFYIAEAVTSIAQTGLTTAYVAKNDSSVLTLQSTVDTYGNQTSAGLGIGTITLKHNPAVHDAGTAITLWSRSSTADYSHWIFSAQSNLQVGSKFQVLTGSTPGVGAMVFDTGPLQTIIQPYLRTSGSTPYFVVTTPADITLAASTECIGSNFTAATRQFATGTIERQRERVFAAPTYGFVGASTVTEAINVDIALPAAGTNATLTNAYALRSGHTLVLPTTDYNAAQNGNLKISPGGVTANMSSSIMLGSTSGGTGLNGVFTIFLHQNGNSYLGTSGGILRITTGYNSSGATILTLDGTGAKVEASLGVGAAASTTSFAAIAAGTTAKAQINLAAGTAPTSPANGDIWFDGTDLKMRVGGVTKTFTLA